MRVLVGVGAWFVGVGAATGGSLLAVSLLGQGIAASTTQQLTEAAVTRALATESTEAQPGVLTASAPAGTPSGRRSHTTHPPTTPPPQAGASPTADPPSARPSPSHSRGATPSATPTPASGPTPTPTPTTTQTPPPSTVLTSRGGNVVAECLPGGAYLVSWSPTQGYEIGPVVRGPASTAQVKFESPANTVTMVVSCSTGVPTATTTITPTAGGTGRTDE